MIPNQFLLFTHYQTIRVGIPKVFFIHERQLGNILKGIDIIRMNPCFLHALVIKRGKTVNTINKGF
jgi:prophage DNA circulation protein